MRDPTRNATRNATRIVAAQLRASLALAMQYRADLLIDGVVEILWTSTALVPLFVVFGRRSSIAGWSFGEALVVVGFFTLLQAIVEGVISPSLAQLVEGVARGTFDFVLLKPADAQLLVSTARVQPWRSINVVTAIALFVVAFRQLGRLPHAVDVALALAMLLSALTTLYSLWLLILCTSFRSVRLDGLSELVTSIFDAARWPSSVFRGAARFVFTFVIPLTLMTTVPARALLGVLDGTTVVASFVGAAIAFGVSRAVWLRSIGGYTSASS